MNCSACGAKVQAGQPSCSRCGQDVGSWGATRVGVPSGRTLAPESVDAWGATRVGVPAGRKPAAPAGTLSEDGSSIGSIRGGQVIAGRYVIEKMLGRGGVGVVYLANDTTLNEAIAIKLLQPDTHRDPRDVDRFKREILTARRITHPNVIRIHDFGMSGGDAFISMEVLPGGTLADRIERGPVPIREAVGIAIEICEGLEAAHEAGIIHRDLKPENVMFDGAGHSKLVDFGLARLAQATTRTVGFSGTPFYMSPEQANGQDVTSRSDIYSLGVMLYELFCGRLPFIADSLIRLAILHGKERPAEPRSIRPEIPVEIDAIIMRALEKDPADRYARAADLAADLAAWREGRALSRRPVAKAAVAPPWAEASPAPAPVARGAGPSARFMAGAILLVGSLSAAVWQVPRFLGTLPAGTPDARAAQTTAAPAATAVAADPIAVAPTTPEPTPASRPAVSATARPTRVALATPRLTSPLGGTGLAASTPIPSVPALSPAEEGDLHVHGIPWATVVVDGKDRGIAQAGHTHFPISAGKHDLVLRCPQNSELRKPIVVQANKPLEIKFDCPAGNVTRVGGP